MAILVLFAVAPPRPRQLEPDATQLLAWVYGQRAAVPRLLLARRLDDAGDRAGRHRDSGRLDRARARRRGGRGSRRDRSPGVSDRRGGRSRADRRRAAPSLSATACRGPGSSTGPSPSRTLASSASRTSLTATRGARTCSTCIDRRSRLGHRPHAHPPARRSVSRRQQEPRGAAALLPARASGLGLHQRELSASQRSSPDPLDDVKKVLAWVRERGPEYGADPNVVFLAGSSAGGHLAAMTALTEDPFGGARSSACTATTARSGLTAPHRWRSTAKARRRSSSRIPSGTRSSSSRMPAGSLSRSGKGPTTPSSMPSCRARSTGSTSSTRFVSRR